MVGGSIKVRRKKQSHSLDNTIAKNKRGYENDKDWLQTS